MLYLFNRKRFENIILIVKVSKILF